MLRHVSTAAGLAIVCALAYLLLLGQGAVTLDPGEVLSILTGGGTNSEIAVVWDLRLPVALTTVVVGAALGVAGAWTQTVTRNPLASPDFLGVTSGAAVAVVAGTVLFRPAFAQDWATTTWRTVLALLGGVSVVGLLFLLSGGKTTNRIIVVGFALSQLGTALVGWMILKADVRDAATAHVWLAGSTGLMRWDAVWPLVVGCLIFLLLGTLVGRDLKILAHDDATARSLGVPVRRQRALVIIAATGLAAVVVSMVGPIGFVALIAPHVARLATRDFVASPLVSAIAGATMLTVCAVIAGRLGNLAPVGLVTSIAGGVSLLVLVLTKEKKC